MKETRFNIGLNTLKQIDGLHGEEVYNTIQEISPAIADLLVELFGDIYTRPNLDFKERETTTQIALPPPNAAAPKMRQQKARVGISITNAIEG